MTSIGHQMYEWARDLFPICRSLTGNGVRETLKYIGKELTDLKIHEIPSGTVAFDWTVPDEWNIKDAFVADENGRRIIDFKKNNLHIVGYSEPVDEIMSLDELQKHLYSLPDQPEAIPYVTSFYKRIWGFCISENERKKLSNGKYHIKIDSTLEPGFLTYGELILPGKTEKEILLSTYICHPSMANNELSGPVVATALANWIKTLKEHNYTYRILFLPETIGSILYLSKHADKMKTHTIAGFVLTCLGDNKSYSYLPSRFGNTLADRVAQYVLKHHSSDYKSYSFLDRGSDERQYCSPGIELPVCSIMRSKYLEYPEYHTSLDNMSLISPEGLMGGYEVIRKCIEILEANALYRCKVLCEPQLGKRELYPTLSTKNSANTILNFIAYADGKNDLITIAEILNVNVEEILETLRQLLDKDLLEIVK